MYLLETKYLQLRWNVKKISGSIWKSFRNENFINQAVRCYPAQGGIENRESFFFNSMSNYGFLNYYF